MVFSSDREGNREVYVMRVAGGQFVEMDATVGAMGEASVTS
jgi:hypothetical protein